MTLSDRGHRLADQPLRPDFDLFERAMNNPYDPVDNPAGSIPLCIAENLLGWPQLRDRFVAPLREGTLPEWTASYAPMLGHPTAREAVARFLERQVAGVPLDADRLALSAGATATVELTALLLGDADDVALFPAPAYQVYAHDIGAKAGMQQAHLHGPLTPAALDEQRAHCGHRLRMLVLTSPNNPTGEIYPEATLREVADWCVANEVHLVVNEIYALSQFTDAAGPPYFSFLRLIESYDSDYLHWWYSFSKDFGISGMRVGVLYSRSEDLLRGMSSVNAPHQVSTITQYLLADLLADHDWVDRFRRGNQQRITAAYRRVTDLLDRHGVPYAPARGSLFVWMDLSAYLGHPSDAHYAEHPPALRTWYRLFDEYGLLLTAPQGFGTREDGWFRLVYSCIAPATLEEAVRRLGAFLENTKGE